MTKWAWKRCKHGYFKNYFLLVKITTNKLNWPHYPKRVLTGIKRCNSSWLVDRNFKTFLESFNGVTINHHSILSAWRFRSSLSRTLECQKNKMIFSEPPHLNQLTAKKTRRDEQGLELVIEDTKVWLTWRVSHEILVGHRSKRCVHC